MASFLICTTCCRTISAKKLDFIDGVDEKIKMGGDLTDNSDLFEKLNITDICCKRTVATSQLDAACKEYYGRRGYYNK